MDITINLSPPSPTIVNVNVSDPQSLDCGIEIAASLQPLTVTLSCAAETIQVNLSNIQSPVSVTIAEARDAYQLAVSEGYVGTRSQWLASLRGTDGSDAEIIVVESLAAYLALSPAAQMNGAIYLVPKAS